MRANTVPLASRSDVRRDPDTRRRLAVTCHSEALTQEDGLVGRAALAISDGFESMRGRSLFGSW
jgi:hypothetical protein